MGSKKKCRTGSVSGIFKNTSGKRFNSRSARNNGKNAEREINAMVTDIKRNIVFSDGKAILISDNDKAEAEITTDGERIEPAKLARTVLEFCGKQKYSIDETRKVMLEIMQAVNESTENLQHKSEFKIIGD